ncbi:insulinase family protein [Massilia sp. PAMC28688]|uniref:M16 family metallopeptidase n=1 Tax=Massilia sp. PAMC28688 TaxID=2861283 RepID=UPI001C632FF0|nr:insulinase family protein [Massilia sp. PAMC28688]QYF93883.1 insulinase family protein [Massilia sp. PAMC28688]
MSKSLARSLVCAIILVTATFGARAELRLADPLPVSPQVTVGKLPNGLTYYLRKNTRPQNKLELRLVVKAGSILEDDDQQGFAHFLEHMAFNGTSNFKKQELVSYLESIGVRFGADLNAYTSFDETVYILPIPTTRRSNVEQGFRVLRDWAGGITLNAADIDQERPVLLEELRLGKGARDRMDTELLPKMFNGSRYAQRLPIGQEAIIRKGSHEALRRFYRDWYRPDLMAVIVVGDIDTADAERLVKRHFSDLKNPAQPRKRFEAPIAPSEGTQALVITDKEAGGNQILIRYPVRPVKESDTVGGYREDLVQSLFTTMLNQRMLALSQRADAPFLDASSAVSRLTARYEAYTASASLGKGGARPAIDALVHEHARASKFGFTAAELERTKKNLLRRFERGYAERDKTDSAALVGEFVRNFLNQESIPGIENEYRYARELVPGITLEEMNRYARDTIPTDSPKLVVYMGTDNERSMVPTSAQLLAAFASAEKAEVKPRSERALAASLMPVPPKAGSIVAESFDKRLGVTTLSLSNGVKVMLKPTDFRNDQVIIGATRFGGQSLAADQDIINARYAASVAGVMGVGDFTPLDLSDMLAGKTATVSASLSNYTESVRGASGSADIEAMLQLLYLKMTTVRRDPLLFQTFVARQVEASRNTMAQPEAVFEDAQVSILYANHPRVPRVPRPEEFEKIDMERALAFYQERFGSARGMTFLMVGSFAVDSVKPLIATYLASLPTDPITRGYRDLGANPIKGVVKHEVRAGSEDKSVVSINFTGDAVYSEQEQMRMNAMLDVMNMRIVDVLREKLALIYGGGMNGAIGRIPTPHYRIGVNLPTSPASVDKVIAATFAEIERMKTQGPSAANLDKVKQNWLANHRNALRENGYWMSRLQSAVLLGTDPASMLSYEARVKALTVDDLKLAARRYFDMRNYVQVVLYPEKK